MKTKTATIASLLAALLLPLAASAQDAETVTVLATGHGVDPDAAKKAAGRAAIEQVVGQLVDAETLVENDELVKDRILTYSGAYLEDLEVVGAPSQADGLWTVKVLAKVRKTQLAQKLKAENVKTVAVKKGRLFAKAASKAQEAEDAAAMAEKAFEGFPDALVVAEPCRGEDGDPEIDVDANGLVKAKIRIGIDPDAWREWTKDLMQKFDALAVSCEDETVSWDWRKRDLEERGTFLFPRVASWPDKYSRQKGEFRVTVLRSVRPGAVSAAARTYRFSGDSGERIRAVLETQWKKALSLSVDLMADDDVLGSARVEPGFSNRMPRRAVLARFGIHPDDFLGYVAAPFLADVAPWSDSEQAVCPLFETWVSVGTFQPDVLEDATDIRVRTAFR